MDGFSILVSSPAHFWIVAALSVFFVYCQVRPWWRACSSVTDVTHYISNDFNGVEVRRFDEYMLDSIRQAITDPASQKTIFIHMMGSHAAYENRYPDNFARAQACKCVEAR